jgi:hypothetical protein
MKIKNKFPFSYILPMKNSYRISIDSKDTIMGNVMNGTYRIILPTTGDLDKYQYVLESFSCNRSIWY